MSDDNAYQRNVNKRMAEELAEADEPRDRAQAQLDHWVQSERDVEAEYRRLMRELNRTGLKIW